MKYLRSIAAMAAALAVTAGSAQAQLIRFATTGAFSGTGCDVFSGDLFSTSCRVDGAGGSNLTLKYTFGEQQVLDGFGGAQFGMFTTSGMGPVTFEDVLFTLTIVQTSPTNETSFVDASIMGTVAAIQGDLQWGPIEPSAFSLGDVNYKILVDAGTNSVAINPPGENGVISSEQTIRGFVTTSDFATVPEPAAFALMLVGMAGIALAARRRNHAA